MIDQTSTMTRSRKETSNATTFLFRLFTFVLPIVAWAMFPGSAPKAQPAAASGDAEPGKQAFDRRCTGCHSLDQDKEGPRLHHVYGSKAGSVASFKYSVALKSSHLVWDERSLDQWLQDPDSLVPDNDMAFHVPKADERADIIRFLEASAGK
jgi:cytochrome c